MAEGLILRFGRNTESSVRATLGTATHGSFVQKVYIPLKNIGNPCVPAGGGVAEGGG